MRENCMQIRKEVQEFITASERLHRILSGGPSLNVHEAETVQCCLDQLSTEESQHFGGVRNKL
jgi:hypothetical protein